MFNVINPIKNTYKTVKEKLNKIPLSNQSDEYQDMLVGTKIYFDVITRGRTLNVLFYGLIGIYIITFFLIASNFSNRTPIPITTYLQASITIFVFFAIFLIVLAIYTLKKQYNFKFIKGFKIFLRDKGILRILLLYFISLIFFFFPLSIILPMINYLNYILFYSFFIGVACIFIFIGNMCFMLNAFPFIKYAKQKLQEIINQNTTPQNEKINISNHILFYSAIYFAYETLSKNIKNNFGTDVITVLKINKLQIIASQIVLDDSIKKKIIDILSNLEKIRPLKDPKEFINYMNEIEKEFGASFHQDEKSMDSSFLFRRKSIPERIKTYVIFLIPFINIVVSYLLNINI
jgi:hypothetical protein